MNILTWHFLVPLFSLLLILPTVAWAENPLCTDVYGQRSSETLNTSGFINPFAISKEQKSDQENYTPPPPPKGIGSFFNGPSGRGQVKSEAWLEAYLKQDSGAIRALNELIKLGKGQGIRNLDSQSQTLLYIKIFSMRTGQWKALTPSQAIQIYSLFATRNLLPPEAVTGLLNGALNRNLAQWSYKDFQHFARARRMTPMHLSFVFNRNYAKAIAARFNEFPTTVKMEVLAAELIHGRTWNEAHLQKILQQLNDSLSQQIKHPTYHPISLKDLYRGILRYKAEQMNPRNQELIDSLIEAIDYQLQKSGVSLAMGGRSGTDSPDRGRNRKLLTVIEKLDSLLGDRTKTFEYFNPERPGFFDPVDAFYGNKKLIVEWDGPQHSFRYLTREAQVDTSRIEILRPLDQAKDSSLRAQGVAVLRVSFKQAHRIDEIDFSKMIQQQNPMWSF